MAIAVNVDVAVGGRERIGRIEHFPERVGARIDHRAPIAFEQCQRAGLFAAGDQGLHHIMIEIGGGRPDRGGVGQCGAQGSAAFAR